MSGDAAVQEAYAAYLDAWVDLANMPGVSERSADQEAAAAEAGRRLDEAAQAHYDACAERQRELDDAEPDAEPDPEPDAEPDPEPDAEPDPEPEAEP